MTNPSQMSEPAGVTRRTFLITGAAASTLTYLSLLPTRAQAETRTAPPTLSESDAPTRPHQTLLGVL